MKRFIVILCVCVLGTCSIIKVYSENKQKEIITDEGYISSDWGKDGFLIRNEDSGKEYCVSYSIEEICETFDVDLTVGSVVYFEFTQTDEEYAPPEISILKIREMPGK